MNEVLVDRFGTWLTLLDCSVDGMRFTRVQADGIICATPTGSIAYSLSAGGSMVHPEVPTILFTPICPHSLSFRPLLFPDTSTLQIRVSEESRGSNCVSFDGRNRVELHPGDSVLISMSRWPLPSICRADGTSDWFEGVRSVLQWNSRTASQKPIDVKYTMRRATSVKPQQQQSMQMAATGSNKEDHHRHQTSIAGTPRLSAHTLGASAQRVHGPAAQCVHFPVASNPDASPHDIITADVDNGRDTQLALSGDSDAATDEAIELHSASAPPPSIVPLNHSAEQHP